MYTKCRPLTANLYILLKALVQKETLLKTRCSKMCPFSGTLSVIPFKGSSQLLTKFSSLNKEKRLITLTVCKASEAFMVPFPTYLSGKSIIFCRNTSSS